MAQTRGASDQGNTGILDRQSAQGLRALAQAKDAHALVRAERAYANNDKVGYGGCCTLLLSYQLFDGCFDGRS